jgi:hypothetical protein
MLVLWYRYFALADSFPLVSTALIAKVNSPSPGLFKSRDLSPAPASKSGTIDCHAAELNPPMYLTLNPAVSTGALG